MAAPFDRFTNPRITTHLIADEGEVVIDEVRKHWCSIVKPALELLLAVGVLVLGLWVPSQAYWLFFAVFFVLGAHAGWQMLGESMDRFVITNMRVFRVNGIVSQNLATMPMSRILDVAVHKPLLGRIFGYGHFVFESAAQDQGLRDIRFVGRPYERDLTIQRVIQRSGLRSSVPIEDE